MSVSATKTDTPDGEPPPIRRLRLNSVKNARSTMGRLIRLVDRGEISEGRFRTITYGMATHLAYLKAEKELVDFDGRLAAIEEALCTQD